VLGFEFRRDLRQLDPPRVIPRVKSRIDCFFQPLERLDRIATSPLGLSHFESQGNVIRIILSGSRKDCHDWQRYHNMGDPQRLLC